jgi:5-methylcytosine-specific restriction enzyme A
MPKPPHLCTCGKTVAHGVQCACQVAATRARNARHDSQRPSAAARGYDREWRKARLEYLATHSLCRMCGNPANTVDHIIPHRGDRRLFWSRLNWQPLCTPCHSSAKQRIERKT